MASKEKLLARLRAKPKDFTWKELVQVLTNAGFEVISGSGSRYKFVHREEKDKVLIAHKPHPENTVKSYIIKRTIEILESIGDGNE